MLFYVYAFILSYILSQYMPSMPPCCMFASCPATSPACRRIAWPLLFRSGPYCSCSAHWLPVRSLCLWRLLDGCHCVVAGGRPLCMKCMQYPLCCPLAGSLHDRHACMAGDLLRDICVHFGISAYRLLAHLQRSMQSCRQCGCM